MPIYVYRCRDCEKDFEEMRPLCQMDAPLKCTHCGSDQTERLLTAANFKCEKAAG